MQSISAKVSSLGHSLPEASAAAANYVPFARAGDLLHISGQIAKSGGAVIVRGLLGATVTPEQGHAAAQGAGLCVLAQLAAAVGDDLDRVVRVVKLGVFVAATPQFSGHSQVANGASDLLVAVLGDAGKHARTSVGVASLPLGAAVEVDAVVQIRG
jgi:enamine deaminase RidA (YjgF/YER057c/UK114 family)